MSSAGRLGEIARATRQPGAARRPKCGTDPGVDQRELCAGGRIPKAERTLVLRDAQHEYVFEEM